MSEKEREYVAGMYPSSRWRKKVAKMSDAQVIAIFLKAQSESQNKQDKPPDPPEDPQIPF